MQKFERAEFEVAEYVESEKYGKFVLSPLERGFGTTIGNALRRVLLSSLPGAAIFSIKVDGVYHEFTTIPGVREDVSMIIVIILLKLYICDLEFGYGRLKSLAHLVYVISKKPDLVFLFSFIPGIEIKLSHPV